MLEPAWLAPPALLAGSALVHAGYQAGTRARYRPDGRFVEVDGARLHVTCEGAGPAVVLIHGANASHHDFDAPLRSLLAASHTVITLDRPGHAHSDRMRGTHDLRANARAVSGVIAALDTGPAILVGHSYGTPVALRTALDAPQHVRGVVAVAPAFVSDARNLTWARLSSIRPLALLGVWTLPLLLAASVAPRVRRDAWHPATPPSGWSPSRAFPFTPEQMRAATDNLRHLPRDLAALHRDLAGLRAPLRIVAAAEDRITPWERHAGALHRAVPGSALEVVPGTGHWVFRQLPERIASQVSALG